MRDGSLDIATNALKCIRVSPIFQQALQQAAATFASLQKFSGQIDRAASLVSAVLTGGHQLLACGNGGSAADAADFTTEFACRFVHDRRPYPALNLSASGSLLTATANDYSFDQVFARQVRAFGRDGDLLLALSTSGKSANIRRALDEAKSRGLSTVALLGRDGGDCAGIADLEVIVAGDCTARIQEAHKFLLHVICEMVEPSLPQH
ncbi:MAG: SIS domain-containing protein [Verrucomicrobia bacterium]|nr:SIS domain-containing protein [Verrucomicrobiota bacterium]